MNRSAQEVELCVITDCPLYQFRLIRNNKGRQPLKAIRKKCLNCSVYNNKLVKNCYASDPVEDRSNIFQGTYCTLYPYRMGKNPKKAGKMSAEQREKSRERMKKYHAERKRGKT